MPNLYLDTAVGAEPTPPLDGDARVDVLVVGGGFTGLSTALHLAEQGVKVLVLEAEEPGWGASGRNGGQVNPGLKRNPDSVERDFGMDLGARMNALAGAAPDFVFNLIKRHGIACNARQNGTLRAAVHENHAARVRETTEQLSRRGAPVEYLEGAPLARLVGTDHYAGALFDRRGGDLNPLSYAKGLVRAAIAAGAVVCGRSRALTLTPRGSSWIAGTETGAVTAAHVVLATNGYTDDLWPALRRSIVPLFGAVAATEVMPHGLAQTVMPSRAVLYESGAITVYYRVDTGPRLLIGGRGPVREVTSTASLRHLLAYAVKLWPGLQDVAWTHAWGGRLAMTRDEYPHVHELARGVIACLGYNGRGIALSTVLGAKIAHRITDPTQPFDMPLTPLQPIGLHSLWPLAVRAAIARGRMIDFFGR